MAWGTKTTADFLSGQGAKTGGVEFYNRDLVLSELATGWGWEAEAATTSASFVTVSTRTIRLPDWFLSGAEMKARARFYSTLGATVGSARITETGTPRSGTTLSLGTLGTTAGPGALAVELSGLTAPDDTWAGVLKTFDIELRRDSGSGSVTMNLEALAFDLRFVGL